MKRLLKIVVIGIVVLVLVGVVVAFTVNVDSFRPKLQTELSSALGRQVTIGKLGLSLFSGSVVADDLAIADDPAFSKDPFLTAKEVKIGVALMPLIFSRSLQITGITINTPDIVLLHTPNGVWNYATIGTSQAASAEKNPAEKPKAQPTKQPQSAAGSGTSSDDSKKMSLSVNALDIINGKVTIAEAHTRKGIQNYDNVNLQVRNFSATTEFPIKLSVSLPGSGALNLDGSAGPINTTDASETPLKGKLIISSFDLAKSAYIDRSSGMEGVANIEATFSSDGKKFHTDATIKADKLKLGKTGAPATVPVALKCSVVHDLKQQDGVISNGTLDLGQAAAHFTGNYKLEPETDLSLTLVGDNMPVNQLDPLLPAIGITFPDGSKLQGGTFTVNLKASGPVDHLITTGSVKLADTTLSGFSLGQKLSAASALTGVNTGSDTAIKNLSSDLRIAPDGIQTSNMDLNIPTIGDVTGAGTISATNQLDYHLMAKLTGNGGGALGAVTSTAGSDLPFLVKGTTAKPVIEPDMKNMAKSVAKNQVKSLINGTLGGSGNSGQNPVKSLKGLFGK